MSTKKKVVFSFDEEVSPGRFETRSLIGRIGKHKSGPRDMPDWVSRDYALVVPCKFIRCPLNRSEHCSMPSGIKIGADASCTTGRDLVDKPPVQPKRTVCKWCGGEIVPEYSEFGRPIVWQHLNEKLSHQAEPR
jgi:hypothetical protein